jgi:hypothetical protein
MLAPARKAQSKNCPPPNVRVRKCPNLCVPQDANVNTPEIMAIWAKCRKHLHFLFDRSIVVAVHVLVIYRELREPEKGQLS